MSSPTNETGLVRAINKAVKKKYPTAWIFKVHGGPMQMAGVPDLIISIDGMLIGAEVKHQKPGESETHSRHRATEIQRAQIQAINRSGGMAGVVISVEETLDLIDRAFVKQKHILAERLRTGEHDARH